jgi:uncharacterized protein (TIGR03435 family)
MGARCAGILLLALTNLGGTQTTLPIGPEFEVASVKRGGPPADGRPPRTWTRRGGPGTSDPERLNYTGIPLHEVVMIAWGLSEPWQVSGPGWIESERYDIAAKIGPGVDKAQFQLMLQNLLAERFKLTIHTESREMPAFALVIAKGGAKLGRSLSEAPAPLVSPAVLEKDRNGLPQLRPGRKNIATIPLLMTGCKGCVRKSGRLQSLSDIADMCIKQEERPVIDKTGLTGLYDFNLDFSIPGATTRPMPGQGGMPPPADFLPPDFQTALEQQLGLKLERNKLPVSVIVIDRVEKIPTEN